MYIPNEVVVQILLRLPIKSLLRFRCVCRKWRKFLKHNSDFITKRLNHSIRNNDFTLLFTEKYITGIFSLEYVDASREVVVEMVDSPYKYSKSVEIFGSCNGLLFIKIEHHNLVVGLWNPATREYKIIPYKHITPMGFRNTFYPTSFDGRVDRYGFGYDQESNDYKLVTIVSPWSDYEEEEIMLAEVEVYALRSNSWKRIDYIPYKIMGGPPGVFVNGALHWLAKPCPIRSDNKFSKVLLSFNMAEEVFIEVPHPEHFDDSDRYEHKRVDVVEGLLTMLFSHSSTGFEVWVMSDYGIRESWTKRYTISRAKLADVIPSAGSYLYLRRMHSLKTGKMLLEIQLDEWEYKFATLVIYDPICESARVVQIDLEVYDDPLKVRFHTESYVESLVPLYSGTYVGGGHEESDLIEALSVYYEKYK